MSDVVKIELRPSGQASSVKVGDVIIPGVNKVTIEQDAASFPKAILEITCFEFDMEVSVENVKAILDKAGIAYIEKEYK